MFKKLLIILTILLTSTAWCEAQTFKMTVSTVNTAIGSYAVSHFVTDNYTGAVTLNTQVVHIKNVLIDGSSDITQLKVQSHSTQTNSSFEIENSSGTDILTVDSGGNVYTPAYFQSVSGYYCSLNYGIFATKNFYTSNTSGGSPTSLNTVVIKGGIITGWTIQ